MKKKNFVLMDGGHDSPLLKYVGSGFNGHPLWISRYLLENPDALRRVCQDYVQAGAEMLMTPCYQVTEDSMQKHWNISRDEALDLIKRSVSICQEAIQLERDKGNVKDIKIVGMLGPYGAYLNDGSEYAGGNYIDKMSKEDLMEWHKPKLEALVDSGADCLCFLTIPSLKEAEANIALLKQYPGVKAMFLFSAQNEETISHGELMSDVAVCCWELASDQILAIGVNCLHPRLVLPLLTSIRKANCDIPLLAKSNTTEIFNTTTTQWEASETGKSLPEYCRDWLNLGVEYISGCCRTSPDDIIRFKQEIQQFLSKTD